MSNKDRVKKTLYTNVYKGLVSSKSDPSPQYNFLILISEAKVMSKENNSTIQNKKYDKESNQNK